MSALLGDIGARLAAGLAPLASDLTLRVTTSGGSTEYPCSGWREDGSVSLAGGSLILQGTAVFNVLASSLSVTPKPGNAIVVGGKSHTLKAADLDPTGAFWRLTTS